MQLFLRGIYFKYVISFFLYKNLVKLKFELVCLIQSLQNCLNDGVSDKCSHRICEIKGSAINNTSKTCTHANNHARAHIYLKNSFKYCTLLTFLIFDFFSCHYTSILERGIFKF